MRQFVVRGGWCAIAPIRVLQRNRSIPSHDRHNVTAVFLSPKDRTWLTTIGALRQSDMEHKQESFFEALIRLKEEVRGVSRREYRERFRSVELAMDTSSPATLKFATDHQGPSRSGTRDGNQEILEAPEWDLRQDLKTLMRPLQSICEISQTPRR